MYDLAVKNGNIYINSDFKKLNIYTGNGKIEKITDQDLKAEKTIDASHKKIIPGIIDPHVHFALNAGRYRSADDFKSGSAAAAHGGITTIIDFLDPVSKGANIEKAFEKRLELAGKSLIDFSFHVTAANPVNETENIINEAVRLRMPSVKIFTAYSESSRRTYEKEIISLLEYSRKSGIVILVHAEDEDYIKKNENFKYTDLAYCRPAVSEINMIKKLAELNKAKSGKIYIVHTTCGDSIEFIKLEYPELLNRSFFFESCPHYFIFNETSFKRADGNRFVLAPPLREEFQLNLLKRNIDNIYSIGTDHCPFMSGEKNKKHLKDIPFGIGGIEYSFPVMYSLFGSKIIDRMTLNPARMFGLYPEKGVLAPGSDADFFIYNENQKTEIKGNHSKCDYNLYKGMKVNGFVETTVSGGAVVMENSRTYSGRGRFIPREADTGSFF